MDCSMPGFPVLHCLPEFAQTYIHWVNDAIQPSLLYPSSSCPESFPASGYFPISQPFTSHGESIRASASAWVLRMNLQGWFSLGLTGLISLQSKGLSRVFSSLKTSIFQCSAFFMVQLSHPYLTTGKTIAWTIEMFVGKVMSLHSNTLSSLVIAFLLRGVF